MMAGGTVSWKSVLLLLQSPARDAAQCAYVSQGGTRTPDPAFTQPTPLTHSKWAKAQHHDRADHSVREPLSQCERAKATAFPQPRLQQRSVSSDSASPCPSTSPRLSTPVSLLISIPLSIILVEEVIPKT